MTATLDGEVADLRRANAELQRRLDEAVVDRDEGEAQRAAIAEILEIINNSPGDLTKVFDTILEKAHRLCGASKGSLVTFDGEYFRTIAMRGLSEPYAAILRDAGHNVPGSAPDRLLNGESLVHLLDASDSAFSVPRAAAELEGVRTIAYVPLRKESALLGYITAYRQEVRPFSDQQIALLQNFAAQAVIAMENARLITETREALEQQTATAEILQVINSSLGDLAPVFGIILEKAHTLCGAEYGELLTYDGERFWVAGMHGTSLASVDTRREGIRPGFGFARLVRGERFVHIEDMAEVAAQTPGDSLPRALLEISGIRTQLAVPLRRDDKLLGIITANRREVRPFSDKQIALLENFAAQAVIAMENARLITETREALEQQTATSEVLQVINSSPGDLTPVFDAMLERATRLCEAAFGILWRFEGEFASPAALYQVPPAFAKFWREPIRPGPETGPGHVMRGGGVLAISDLTDYPPYEAREPLVRALVDLGGARSVVISPLRKDDATLGAITVYRKEVRPFSEKEIALLQNFAAQAVIAMENARLITETHEALEQQIATSEVLSVINSSPGDLSPVFDAMLEKATRLCEAVHGHLATFDGEFFRFVAVHGGGRMVEEQQARGLLPPSFGVTWPRLLRGDSVVHVTDVMDTDLYRTGHQGARWFVDIGGGRTCLTIALHKEDALLGALTVYRREVRPFTDKQIALLENFAAQAVIAMENARLLSETQEALEQQTATAEVLQVINSSPGDLAPVFDAMLEKATRLCEAPFGILRTWDGERFHFGAVHGDPQFCDWVRQRGPIRTDTDASLLGRIQAGERVVHITDAQTDEAYRVSAGFREMAEASSIRSAITVALHKDDALLGLITVYRQEVRPFSDKQITLLENFAAQAVIAMENARLLEEIRQRQAELRVTFDNMADGVAMFDEDLRLAAWNRNFQQIADLPEALLAERPSYADYLRILTERGELDILRIDDELNRRLEDTDKELRLERTRPNGRVIEVRRNAVPDGGFVLIYSDITERKRSEAEIHAARDAAEAAYRDLKAAQANLIQAEKMASLGQLTAGIAHEIKNPLNFVTNFAGLSIELLDELKETTAPVITALDEDKRADIDEIAEMLTGNLEKIAEHGRRADNIVKSMLEHSRGSSGERRSVDLNGLVEEALNLAYHGARAQDQSFNITLERDYAQPMPPIELVPQDITRVCLNLVGNGFYAAVKRQQEGGDPKFQPTLKVTTRELGEAVEVRIRDNGIGIPAEIKDKLFQPFFTTKPTGEGTGLGLSISYDIVTQQHGGTIGVDSRIGEFTEFTVRLPRIHRAAMAEAAS